MRPPRGVNLAAFLRRSTGSAGSGRCRLYAIDFRTQLEIEREALVLNLGPADFADLTDHFVDSHALEMKVQLAGGDAAEIQQIVDEFGLEFDIARGSWPYPV